MKNPPGRPELAEFIISTRLIGQPWPRGDANALAEARRGHDEGRVTMCQGRSGNTIIQYAIPTKTAPRRRPYFSHKDYEC